MTERHLSDTIHLQSAFAASGHFGDDDGFMLGERMS